MREAGEASVVEAREVGAVSGEMMGSAVASPIGAHGAQPAAAAQLALQGMSEATATAAATWLLLLHMPLHPAALAQQVPSSANRSPKIERSIIGDAHCSEEGVAAAA